MDKKDIKIGDIFIFDNDIRLRVVKILEIIPDPLVNFPNRIVYKIINIYDSINIFIGAKELENINGPFDSFFHTPYLFKLKSYTNKKRIFQSIFGEIT